METSLNVTLLAVFGLVSVSCGSAAPSAPTAPSVSPVDFQWVELSASILSPDDAGTVHVTVSENGVQTGRADGVYGVVAEVSYTHQHGAIVPCCH